MSIISKISKMSSGESIVFNYLISHGYNIQYGKAYHFLEGLHGDFFIHSKATHIPTIIEYDGSQHFYGWGCSKTSRQNSLKYIHCNDMAKDVLCIKNSVCLIRLEDMKSLSSLDYAKAIYKVYGILDEELPILTHGIHVRFVSLSPKTLSKRFSRYSVNHRNYRKNRKRMMDKRKRYYEKKITKLNLIHSRANQIRGKNKEVRNKDMNQTRKSILGRAINFTESRKVISTTQLQLTFSIGYIKAHKIMNIMFNRHIVGPRHGFKPRKVLKISKKNGLVKPLVNKYDIPFLKDLLAHLYRNKYISITLIQKYYQIGYTRAKRIMSYLILKKYVTAQCTRKLRAKVLVKQPLKK